MTLKDTIISNINYLSNLNETNRLESYLINVFESGYDDLVSDFVSVLV